MAGYQELDNFVKKCIHLWENGCNAKLQFEASAGNAEVSLKVSLGKAKQFPSNSNQDVSSGYRGGSPSRQRRRERRAAARQVQVTAEEAVTKEDIGEKKGTEEVEKKEK